VDHLLDPLSTLGGFFVTLKSLKGRATQDEGFNSDFVAIGFAIGHGFEISGTPSLETTKISFKLVFE